MYVCRCAAVVTAVQHIDGYSQQSAPATKFSAASGAQNNSDLIVHQLRNEQWASENSYHSCT